MDTHALSELGNTDFGAVSLALAAVSSVVAWLRRAVRKVLTIVAVVLLLVGLGVIAV